MTKIVVDSLTDAARHMQVLDLIPGTHAWAKDTDGCFVYGNRLFYERFGLCSVQELVGKTDFDLAPAAMARRYRDDDQQVLAGGHISDRLELIRGQADSIDWFLTSKWPLQLAAGRIIGSCGISQHLDPSERKSAPLRALSAPIDYIAEHFATDISIAALARASHLSVSALERRFRKHLQKTPHQYLTEVRLEHARRLLLETDKPIGEIALETGFSDHGHFSRSFRRRYAQTPSQARR